MLGEGYSLDDREDQNVQTVTSLWIYEVRFQSAVPLPLLTHRPEHFVSAGSVPRSDQPRDCRQLGAG